jgi:hypothetical protein
VVSNSAERSDQASHHSNILHTLSSVVNSQRATDIETDSVIDSYLRHYGPTSSERVKKCHSLLRRVRWALRPEYAARFEEKNPALAPQVQGLGQASRELELLQQRWEGLTARADQEIKAIRANLPTSKMAQLLLFLTMNIGTPSGQHCLKSVEVESILQATKP